ncbi:MAG TPA: endonuclease/exonuclease/phosphatase family protein [Verrucomicrobiae bacterium]
MKRYGLLFTLHFVILALAHRSQAADLRLATYNVENYIDHSTSGRDVKSVESKAKVRESIKALKADVIAVQEIGLESALLELRSSLKADGVDYPYWEHVKGFDTNIFVAVLSKYPFTAKRHHTNANYLLNGRRLQMSRGIAEVDIKVNHTYTFTLLTTHLKAKRAVSVADESDMREEEAKLLRGVIDERLKANPNANLVIMGDFNDTKDSKPIKNLMGRGRVKLTDTRPAERNGDTLPPEKPSYDPRNVAWTHFYGAEDSYSRIDYILLSPGMAREWNAKESYVLASPNWGLASDHRPLVITVTDEDR